MRIVGQCPSASAVLLLAGQNGQFPAAIPAVAQVQESDYAQVDNGLTVSSTKPQHPGAPIAGVGYAGLTPAQRHEFLLWLQTPVVPAPPAFQHLCLANLEVRLLESPEWAFAARGILLDLDKAAAWEDEERLVRALLLAFWLAQDGAPLSVWIASGRLSPGLLGIALGCQAMLGAPLSATQALTIAAAWSLPQPFAPTEVIKLRLASLHEKLGAEILAHALAQLPEEARQSRPWRCTHRDIRLAFPQPDIRPKLAPILTEIVAAEAVDVAPRAAEGEAGDDALTANESWNLILEFQESTSGLAGIALRRAQRMPGYSSLLDEHRRVIHRVRFRKREMSNFWQLWEIVHSWTHTHVYLNGTELEKWRVTPYGLR